MTLPNFFIIGAAKAGTTSLYHYLNQHPGIFMSPEKEPRYFSVKGDTSGNYPYKEISQYERLFMGATNEVAIGEATSFYLFSNVAPRNIKEEIPEAKFIAILRNPVDRAHSHFNYWRRDGKEAEASFAIAVDRDLNLLKNGHTSVYIDRGMYGKQLQRYYKIFRREQIRIYLFEELRDKPREILKDMFHFLGVDDSFQPELTKTYNVTTVPQSGIKYALYSFLVIRQQRAKVIASKLLPDRVYWKILVPVMRALTGTLRAGNQTAPPSVGPEIRNRLVDIYRDDIRLTEELIGRDLSEWR